MHTPDVVKTGITGLDAILESGIPRGNVILLEGGIGTAKTTLGVEFADLERQRKLKIIFLTRQVFGQELQQADSLLLEEASEIARSIEIVKSRGHDFQVGRLVPDRRMASQGISTDRSSPSACLT